MVDTIEKALSPVFLITFFLGYGILHPLNESRYRLSIFYVLTLWSVYAYAVYYAVNLVLTKSDINSSLAFFAVTVNLFVAMISIIITFCKHKKYRQLMKKLGHVDDTLEELGTSKDYRRMQNFIRQILILWFLITCLSWIFDSLSCIAIYNDIKIILAPCILTYSSHANTITDITFILLLRHISNRLDKINDHIEQLSEGYGQYKWKKLPIVSSNNIQSTENRKHVLWTVIHLHLELCRTACEINNFFGIQMTLQMISYFIILIGISYFRLHLILYQKQLFEFDKLLKIMLSNSMWFIIFLIKLVSLNHMCESVSTKAQKTEDIIHKLTNLIYFVDIREEICQFVLQISLRPLKFSGLGLFYFGYGFIRKFFVWMITAVIFMTQMNFTPLWTGFNSRNNVTYYDK